MRLPGPDGVCQALRDGLHQLVKAETATNLLTADIPELRRATSRDGWVDVGVVAMVSVEPVEGLVPVTRLRRQADFVWAQTKVQAATAEQQGYAAGGPTFYAAPVATAPCLTAVYQLQQAGVHRIAVGESARDRLLVAGWKSPEIVFYAIPGDAPSAADVAQPVPTGPTAAEISETDSDRRFTIAVIPDTQYESHRKKDPRLANRVKWLVSKQKALDLRFAIHIGDVVDWDTPDHRMYANAAEAFLPLQAKIPWAAAIGNHDTAAVCPGGSACSDIPAHLGLRNTRTFNTYFPKERFGSMAGQFESGKVDNAYHTFRAGGRDWLVLNLELWPREDVVAWAEKVVGSNPDRNVIIVTHAYLDDNGVVDRTNGGYGAATPQHLYDRLVGAYPNVKLVLSGHTGQAAVRTDTTVDGNRVVSMLQSFHSQTSNPVRLIEVDTDKGSVRTWIYAPSTDTTLRNQSKTIGGLDFVD